VTKEGADDDNWSVASSQFTDKIIDEQTTLSYERNQDPVAWSTVHYIYFYYEIAQICTTVQSKQ